MMFVEKHYPSFHFYPLLILPKTVVQADYLKQREDKIIAKDLSLTIRIHKSLTSQPTACYVSHNQTISKSFGS